MTVQIYPPDSTDPFAAILAIGDSWFWYPKNSLLASILALKQIDPKPAVCFIAKILSSP